MIIETHTLWGREFTPEEQERLIARRDKLIAEGVVYLRSGQFNGVNIREHATEELANGWVEFANSMNPPPLRVEVVTYEED
jgi:hypothetical protein